MTTDPPRGRGQPRLRYRTLASLLSADLPPREPLLEGLMKTGDSLMLWAAPGVGKTMASLSIALAAAGGGAFLGWPVRTPRRVLVVDGEMNVGDLRDRLAALLRGAVGCDARLAGDNIAVLARQDQDPDAPFPDLATTEGQDFVRKLAEELGAALVILDNFSTLAEVEDENSASAMSPVLAFLLKMKQAGLATILVHHSGKGGDTYRGSSKIEATFEAVVGLKATTTVKTASHGTAFDLVFTKYRDKRNGTHVPTTAWLEEEPGGGLKWAWEQSEEGRLQTLCDLVLSAEFPTQGDLAKRLQVHPSQITRMKAKAIGKGLIRESDWERAMKAATDCGARPEGPLEFSAEDTEGDADTDF